MEDHIALADAAAQTRQLGYGVPYHTLQRACQNGQVDAQKIAGRWVISTESLEAFVVAKLATHAA